MSKKLFILLIVLVYTILSVFPGTIYAAPTLPKISGDSAILVESKRGQILYEKRSNTKLHVSTASKIMTSLVAIEKAKLDSKVTISKESINAEGSSLNLEVGEKYTVEDLIFAIMLSPANNASNAIAEFVGGDNDKFVAMMNDKAQELNLKNTHFSNPSGLYDQSQYTTAFDLAVLIRHAISNPTFNSIFSLKAKPWVSGNTTQILVNSNKLFWSYNGVDGGKTGYNDKALQTAITTATRENMRLICVVLDSPENSVFDDSTKLLDYGFSNYLTGPLLYKGQVLNSINFQDRVINLISMNDVYYTYPVGDSYISNIEFNVKKDLHLPVLKDRAIGTARYLLKDNTTIDIDLYSDTEIHARYNIINVLYEKLTENKDIYLLVILLVSLEVILIIYNLGRFFKNKIIKKQV